MMTTRLDVLPHKGCGGAVDFPNLETLRLFPGMRHAKPLCQHFGPCSALAPLRPKTLVVVSSGTAGELLEKIPDLVPHATLESVQKLVLVVQCATGPVCSPPNRQPWAQNMTIVLASARRRILRSVTLEQLLLRLSFRASTRVRVATPQSRSQIVTIVGASKPLRARYSREYSRATVHFVEPGPYFEGNEDFSEDETVALGNDCLTMPAW
jgi:hypothetical protein